MKKIWPYIVVGVILIVVGIVWTLQGFNVLQGSAMSGSSMWAIIGPIVLIVGVVLVGIGLTRRRHKTP